MARSKLQSDEYSSKDLEEIVDFCAKFTHDPVGWIWAAYPWGEKDSPLEGRAPQKWQLELLQEIKDGIITPSEAIQVAVASGHGIGKSAIVSILIDWAMSTMEDCKGVVTANTERQLMTKTWAELAKWHRMSISAPLFKYEATSFHSIDKDHEKTWRIDAIPWSKQNSEAFAGLHNHGKRIVIIFDEASAIDDVIWEVVEGATTDEDTEIIWCAFGNPTRPSGRFYQCFKKFRAIWKCKQIDSREVEITNKKKLKEWEELYGEDSDFFKVRVKGAFPSSGTGQLITYEMVEAAKKRYNAVAGDPKCYNFAPVVFGLDPAWEGTDLLVLYMRQGNYSKVLMSMAKNDDDWFVAGKVAAFAKEYQMAQGFIDQGYGTGIYSALKNMGFDNFRLVPFSMSASDDYYLNKRIEMWDKMKEWLKEGGAIEPREDISDDLTAPEAYINVRGKFQLESKDDMKDRGLQSPNYGDALALTFAFPVVANRFDKFRQAKSLGQIRKAGTM